LSVVNVLVFNRNNLYQWLVGIISLFLNISIIFLIIELNEYKNALYDGLIVGIIINAAISIYALFMYRRGIAFNLKEYFPATKMAGVYLSNAFSARGLFREQGHLMRFLAIFFFPVTIYSASNKGRKETWILAVILFIMMIFTGSATLAIFSIAAILFCMIELKKNVNYIRYVLYGVIVVSALIIFGSGKITIISDAISLFIKGMSDIFEVSGKEGNGASNGIRLQGMIYALNIIKQYPVIGCGWNNLTKVFMSNGYYGKLVLGSYSAALSLIAEMGICSIFYFYFIVHSCITFFNAKRSYINLGWVISIIIYFAEFVSTDYSLDAGSSVWLALLLIQLKKLEMESRNDSMLNERRYIDNYEK
jgi:hypothetical protein